MSIDCNDHRASTQPMGELHHLRKSGASAAGTTTHHVVLVKGDIYFSAVPRHLKTRVLAALRAITVEIEIGVNGTPIVDHLVAPQEIRDMIDKFDLSASQDVLTALALAAADPNQWQHLGRCRETDPDMFYPEGSGGGGPLHSKDAKRICKACPVMMQCRQWALDTDEEYGIWGGLSEAERKKIRRERARAGQTPTRRTVAPTRRAV